MKNFLLALLTIYTVPAYTQSVKLNIPNGHAKNIEQVAITSDGKYIASVSYKTVMVWEAASKKKIHEINLNISLTASETNTLAITDKLDKLVVSTNSGLFCYNIQTGKEIFTNGGSSGGATFSRDGSKVYAIDYGTLNIFNAASGNKEKFIVRAVDNTASDCKFYELGNDRLIILNNYGWSIINIVTDEIVIKKVFANIYAERLKGYDYSRKDNLVIGFREEYLISFDPLKGTEIKRKTPTYDPYGICATANGELVVFSSDYKTKSYKTEVLKSADFSAIKTTSKPAADVPEAIFYANVCLQIPGTDKIVFNNDKKLNIYDNKEGSFSSPFQNRVTDFKQFYYYKNLSQRIQPDNVFAFSTEDYGIRSFNMETFKPESFVPGTASAVYSPDGKLVAGIGKKITLSSRITGKIIKTLPLPVGVDNEREFFFFSYDNTKIIYSVREKGGLSAIDINTGTVSKVVSLGSSYYECSASYDGKYFACLVTFNGGEYLRIYNFQTKQVAISKKTCNNGESDECIGGVTFLNESYYLLAVKQKDNISIFKADDPAYNSSFKLEHLNQFSVLGGDIKNNIIAIGEIGQYQVGTYNLKLITLEGKVLKTFNAENNNDFLKAAFSKDDKVMFTATTQKGVQVWKTGSGELLGTYYFIEKTNEYIFVSPEGLFDGSVEGMKELYFVKNNKPIPLEKLYEKFYTPDLLRRKVNGEKFLPPDVANLHDAPKVSIAYAAVQRNLEVADDMPTYQNTTGAAEITVTASAPEDVVDEIRLFHNGKVLTLVTRNLIVEDEKSATAVKKYTINLLPGQNNIRAVSLNTQRTESDPDEITVVYNAGNANGNVVKPIVNNTAGAPVAVVDKNATLHLIVVGINVYQNKNMSLNYALADATAFKDEVEKDAKSMISNIKTYFVTDTEADKKGIEKAFSSVKQNARPEDLFVFYYAGHGVIGKDKEFYLVPTDVSDLKNVQAELEQKGFASKLLQQYAIDIAAQKQLFILDACQSAGAFETMVTADANQQKSIALVARSTGTHWMAASGAQQFANEFASLGHGVFTYVLLNALKGEAASNKMITVNGLKNFLQVQVPALMKKYNGAEQYPASYGFGNDFPVEITNK